MSLAGGEWAWRPGNSQSDVVLVIGAHREELAFGERVAECLPRGLVDVYRRVMPGIGRGIQMIESGNGSCAIVSGRSDKR